MIAFALSNVLGGLIGLVPRMLDLAAKKQDHKHELEHMTRLAEIQRESARMLADSKLREMEASVIREEAQAARESLTRIIEVQGRRTGIAWVDAYNAILRPACVTVVIVLFTWVAVVYVSAIVGQFHAGRLAATDMARMIETGFVGEAILSVFGFLFGARQTSKK